MTRRTYIIDAQYYLDLARLERKRGDHWICTLFLAKAHKAIDAARVAPRT